MNLIYHKNLDIEKWFSKSVSYQMANIGSEVIRMINWTEKGKPKHSELAFERALELIDLTILDDKNCTRLKEILRMRELLVGCYLNQSNSIFDKKSWLKYFESYNYYARLETGSI